MADPEKEPTKPPFLFSGSCPGGQKIYDSTSLQTSAQSCHCVTCRKLSGGPYQSFADVVSKEVIFYDNKERLRYEGLPKDSIGGITFVRFSDIAERAFCIDCYSPLAMRYKQEYEEIGLLLATVDEKTIQDGKVKEALTPKAHIFLSQKV